MMKQRAQEHRPGLNRLRALWAEGRCALGAIATIPAVQVVQVLARSGLDFILIDIEHGPVGPAEAHAMIAATAGTPLVPLARVAATTPWHAKVPLDLGAMGVCFPLVSTRADAEAAVRAVRYPPGGERAWGPFYAPLRWGLPMRDYQDRADDEVLAIATIEHVGALDTIDEVVATPGLDLAFIGPGDLATSMGHRGRAEHPEVQAAALRFEEAIRPSPVVMGGVAPTPEQADAMVARGYRALVVGFDWSLLQRGCAAAIEGIAR
jgi:4-hydroxy-2-oxoheptanedioate aldolase